MENHPIPQDITGFQFKLIGKMTIKQFVYLAVGSIIAWIVFFIINFPVLIKWPVAFISFTLGAMVAFVPIDGRPMDVMLRNFINALISPTKFMYQKDGGKITDNTLPDPNNSKKYPIPNMHNAQTPIKGTVGFTSLNNQKIAQTSPTPITSYNQFPIKSNPAPPTPNQPKPADATMYIQVHTPQQQPKPQQALQPAAIPYQQIPAYQNQLTQVIMSIDDTDQAKEIEKKNKELKEAEEEREKLKKEMEELKKQLDEAIKNKEKNNPATPPASTTPLPSLQPSTKEFNTNELEKQLAEANREKDALQNAFLIQQAKTQTPTQGVTPSAMPEAPKLPTQRVRSITPGMEKAAGIPSMPESPNLITGIVKDPRGNPLQNILIEVKDQDANPVRAFKTNGLGKFASATPLSNGKYLITFEDTKEVNKFDAVEIELVGAPFMPLEIISIDPREELRRELFK